jgi:hypothetical protein
VILIFRNYGAAVRRRWPAIPREHQLAPVKPEHAQESKAATVPAPTRYGDWERNGRCADF